MTLSEKQQLFAKCLGQLLTWIYTHEGWGVSTGEAERTQVQADLNSEKGTGIKKSNHLIRLAIDLNLFINGEFRTDRDAYKALGDYWKSLDPLCRWGGDFHDTAGNPKPDSDHFSLEHEGIK